MEENQEKTHEEVNQNNDEGGQAELVINETKLQNYIDSLKTDENLVLGIVYGFIAALIGALVWATVTIVTGYQIGYLAMAVGFIVGYAVRIGGKGISTTYSIIGAILALFGCVLGNLFSIIAMLANQIGSTYLEIFGQLNFSLIPDILMETFNPMDILFYGFAIYEGYKFSIRQLTDEEIIEHAGEKVYKNT